jgi:hypothetical protein
MSRILLTCVRVKKKQLLDVSSNLSHKFTLANKSHAPPSFSRIENSLAKKKYITYINGCVSFPITFSPVALKRTPALDLEPSDIEVEKNRNLSKHL